MRTPYVFLAFGFIAFSFSLVRGVPIHSSDSEIVARSESSRRSEVGGSANSRPSNMNARSPTSVHNSATTVARRSQVSFQSSEITFHILQSLNDFKYRQMLWGTQKPEPQRILPSKRLRKLNPMLKKFRVQVLSICLLRKEGRLKNSSPTWESRQTNGMIPSDVPAISRLRQSSINIKGTSRSSRRIWISWRQLHKGTPQVYFVVFW